MGELIDMAKQWEYIARGNAFFGVASWKEFERLDQLSLELFWKSGREDDFERGWMRVLEKVS